MGGSCATGDGEASKAIDDDGSDLSRIVLDIEVWSCLFPIAISASHPAPADDMPIATGLDEC